MSTRSANCPSCGAPKEDVDQAAAMAVCDYCGVAFYFKDESILAMGKMAILVDLPTPLYVGATGELRGRRFQVHGRLRYRYTNGFWDEWFVLYADKSEEWIVDDELELSLERSLGDPGGLPSLKSLSPGDPIRLGGKKLFIDEIDTAYIDGAEGWLPLVLALHAEFPYVDASQGEATFTIEYGQGGVEVFQGTWIDAAELNLDHPNPNAEGPETFFDA